MILFPESIKAPNDHRFFKYKLIYSSELSYHKFTKYYINYTKKMGANYENL